MDKIVDGVSKIFSHLARDIQNYIITGLIIIGELYLLDYYYNDGNIFFTINQFKYVSAIIIISAYIFGHICLGFFSLVLELGNIENWISRKMFTKRFKGIEKISDETVFIEKAKLLLQNRDIYFHFIERNVNLATLRWNYTSAFIICFGANIIFYLFVENHRFILIVGLISLCVAVFLFILHVITVKENTFQINELIKILMKKDETQGPTDSQ